MKALTAAVIGLTLFAPAPACAGEIRALFVGIDRYLYSATPVPGSRTVVPEAGFRNLRGAVADTMAMREAMRTTYKLDIDTPPGQRRASCKTGNAVSITLTDTCATRAEILGAFRRQVAASRPADTLLFYYAGHGAQFLDTVIRDQKSGYNDTIMPTDARKPGAQTDGDILDRELRAEIDAATDKGINIVTIFDSCNSGTATRDPAAIGEARKGPSVRMPSVRPMVVTERSGPGGGYRVHLAAAADGEEAREVGKPGERKAGVFTTALVKTLTRMPNARFADIATEVRLSVNGAGHSGQNPQAEGALGASLGGTNDYRPTLDASPSGDGMRLAAGKLSGVTVGSTHALFQSTTDALAPSAVPFATGEVTRADDVSALLRFNLRPPGPLPPRLVAIETAHAFGGQPLLIRQDAVAPEDRPQVAAAIAGLTYAKIGELAQLQLTSGTTGLRLVGLDGIGDVDLGPAQDAGFGPRLRRALQKVARVQALLDLARVKPLGPQVATPAVSFCISSDLTYDLEQCPQATTSDGPALKLNQPAKIAVVNQSEAPLFVYVFAIDQDLTVNLMLPPNSGVDNTPLAAGAAVQRSDTGPVDPGRLQFLTLATPTQINATALEQSGVGARDGGCINALERILCAANVGTRDPSVSRVGAWSAILSSAMVK